MQTDKIDQEQIIPLIYQDFGRARGPIESAKYFKELIEDLNGRFFKEYNLKPLMMEVGEIRDFYNNKENRDKLLFSFNFVQDLEARGLYPIIARKHDVCFSKLQPPAGFNNEYAQAKLHSEIVGMEYFPKYFLGPVRDLQLIQWSWKKLYYRDTQPKGITIGIYHRIDTCPVQTRIYKKFKLMFPEFKFVEIGNIGYNLPYMKAEDFRDQIDLVLYTPPTHADPWPNTIFECLASSIPVIFLHRKNQVIGSGIQELRMLFPKLFVDYFIDHLEDRDSSHTHHTHHTTQIVNDKMEYINIFCVFWEKVLPGDVANFSGKNREKALSLVHATSLKVQDQIRLALLTKFKSI